MQALARARSAARTRDSGAGRGSSPRRRAAVVLTPIAVLIAAVACAAQRSAPPAQEDSSAAFADSGTRATAAPALAPQDSAAAAARAAAPAPAAPAPPQPVLSPLADSIAQYLVFAPTVQTWFLAAKRGKRLLVDIGRVDTDVHQGHARVTAYLQAVKALSPLPIGTPLRLYHAWGQDDATVAGYGDWNGRIVATIQIPRHLDSLVAAAPAAYAAVMRVDTAPQADTSQHADSAHGTDTTRRTDTARHADAAHRADTARRGDTTATAAPDSCRRDSVSPELLARAALVRDSLEQWLRGLPPPPYDRLVASEKTQTSQVIGCFPGANRIVLAVDLRAGANEWIRERAVLLDTLGRVTSLRVDDYRFKGHDFLAALDPNGAGVDGVVAKGVTEALGATVILAFAPRNRLARWVGGFAWEAR